MSFPEAIDTERLHLRRFVPSDLGAVEAVWADPDVQESLRPGEKVDPPAAARETIDRRIANWQRDGFGLYLMIERDADQAIGWTGPWLQDLSLAHTGEVEIGWTLRRPWWGRGLATEAAISAADATFAHLDLPRFISLIHPSNKRSLALAQRLGMTNDGVAQHKDRNDLELLVYSMSRESWGASPHSRPSR